MPNRVEWETTQQTLQEQIEQRDAQGYTAVAIYRWAQAAASRIQKQLEPQRVRMEAAAEKIEQDQAKQQRYRQEQQQKQQALAEVAQAMIDHPMYESDDRKDQLLSALRL